MASALKSAKKTGIAAPSSGSTKTTPDVAAPTEKRGRGRPASGLPHNEVMKLSTRARRERLLAEGKEELKTFVSAGTKEGLHALKTAKDLSTAGDVIDALVARELKRLHLL